VFQASHPPLHDASVSRMWYEHPRSGAAATKWSLCYASFNQYCHVCPPRIRAVSGRGPFIPMG